MHLSKKTLYVGIIAYSGALLLFQDISWVTATTGTVSLMWIAKVLVDVAFALLGVVRLFGDQLFADDESEDEVAIHKEDLAVSDTALFGLFMANVTINMCYHMYLTAMTQGAASFYFLIWTVAEVVALFLSWVLWSHAAKVQRQKAKTARDEARRGPQTIRQAS